jgi:hypothetical protein
MNPLNKSHRGVLRKSSNKGALILAMAGMLYFAEVPAGSGQTYAKDKIHGGSSIQAREKQLFDQLLRDDDEILAIIKAFTECQK